jgi:hypothetical protein
VIRLFRPKHPLCGMIGNMIFCAVSFNVGKFGLLGSMKRTTRLPQLARIKS